MARILLLDDSPTMHRVVRLTFADDQRLEIAVARNRTEADQSLSAHQTDLIIAYVRFDGMTEPHYFESLRFVTPRILLLAESEENLDLFTSSGFGKILRKPFHSDELRQVVEEMLAQEVAVPARVPQTAKPLSHADSDDTVVQKKQEEKPFGEPLITMDLSFLQQVVEAPQGRDQFQSVPQPLSIPPLSAAPGLSAAPEFKYDPVLPHELAAASVPPVSSHPPRSSLPAESVFPHEFSAAPELAEPLRQSVNPRPVPPAPPPAGAAQRPVPPAPPPAGAAQRPVPPAPPPAAQAKITTPQWTQDQDTFQEQSVQFPAEERTLSQTVQRFDMSAASGGMTGAESLQRPSASPQRPSASPQRPLAMDQRPARGIEPSPQGNEPFDIENVMVSTKYLQSQTPVHASELRAGSSAQFQSSRGAEKAGITRQEVERIVEETLAVAVDRAVRQALTEVIPDMRQTLVIEVSQRAVDQLSEELQVIRKTLREQMVAEIRDVSAQWLRKETPSIAKDVIREEIRRVIEQI